MAAKKSTRKKSSGSSKRSRSKTSRKKTTKKTSRKTSSRKKVTKRKTTKKSSSKRASKSGSKPVKLSRSTKTRPQNNNTPKHILGLLVNFFIPGLGTIISGHKKHGIYQLILLAVGVVTSMFLIGVPLVVIAWVWAMVDSIRFLAGSA